MQPESGLELERQRRQWLRAGKAWLDGIPEDERLSLAYALTAEVEEDQRERAQAKAQTRERPSRLPAPKKKSPRRKRRTQVIMKGAVGSAKDIVANKPGLTSREIGQTLYPDLPRAKATHNARSVMRWLVKSGKVAQRGDAFYPLSGPPKPTAPAASAEQNGSSSSVSVPGFVIEQIQASKQPLTSVQLQAEVRAWRPGAHPNALYTALTRLVEAGKLRKIEEGGKTTYALP